MGTFFRLLLGSEPDQVLDDGIVIDLRASCGPGGVRQLLLSPASLPLGPGLRTRTFVFNTILLERVFVAALAASIALEPLEHWFPTVRGFATYSRLDTVRSKTAPGRAVFYLPYSPFASQSTIISTVTFLGPYC